MPPQKTPRHYPIFQLPPPGRDQVFWNYLELSAEAFFWGFAALVVIFSRWLVVLIAAWVPHATLG